MIVCNLRIPRYIARTLGGEQDDAPWITQHCGLEHQIRECLGVTHINAAEIGPACAPRGILSEGGVKRTEVLRKRTMMKPEGCARRNDGVEDGPFVLQNRAVFRLFLEQRGYLATLTADAKATYLAGDDESSISGAGGRRSNSSLVLREVAGGRCVHPERGEALIHRFSSLFRGEDRIGFTDVRIEMSDSGGDPRGCYEVASLISLLVMMMAKAMKCIPLRVCGSLS